MKKRCIVITGDFNYVTPIRRYWDNYDNPEAKISSMHLGGDFHKELKVHKSNLRVIGSPLLPGVQLIKEAEEGYHYVDGAKLCNIENTLDFPDSIFISERDGWMENISDSQAYLNTFDGSLVINVVQVERMRQKRDSQ